MPASARVAQEMVLGGLKETLPQSGSDSEVQQNPLLR